MVAADLICSNDQQRYGLAVYQVAMVHGALLRPLGNTIYWLPPLNVDVQTLIQLKDITIKAIRSVFQHNYQVVVNDSV